ncbi:MAG TPA: DMT family transporter [Sphingomicrobium sp.]|nr:DMT family transporter [Sphingomicrobium sp.]
MNRAVQLPVQAFLVALGAVAALSIMDAVMKHLVLAIGIIAVSIWRALANLVISAALYLPRRKRWPNRRTIWIHVSRAVVVTIMAVLFFWGIGRVPLAQAIALTFIAPLIAMMLAPLFLQERLSGRSIAGALAAFAGVVVIVIGQARSEVRADVLLGIAAILASAVCYAANILMMRWQALAAKPLEINFFQCIVVMLLWVAALPLVGVPEWPNGQLGWIVIASILSTSGGLLFAWAYARGEASYLAVTEYSAFLWASALGWLVFRESVSVTTLGGAVLIVGGCLVAARRKVAAPPEIELVA